VKRRSNLRLWLRLHVRLCKRCTWRFSPLNAGSRQQAFVGLLQILDEFLFFASSSKCLVPKDHAEVCAIARAVILTGVTGRNGYPDRYNQAFAFSAILYSASLRHPLRSAFRLARERSGLPRFGSITKSVRSRLDAGDSGCPRYRNNEPVYQSLTFWLQRISLLRCLYDDGA
jgi:hypothetical protein